MAKGIITVCFFILSYNAFSQYDFTNDTVKVNSNSIYFNFIELYGDSVLVRSLNGAYEVQGLDSYLKNKECSHIYNAMFSNWKDSIYYNHAVRVLRCFSNYINSTNEFIDRKNNNVLTISNEEKVLLSSYFDSINGLPLIDNMFINSRRIEEGDYPRQKEYNQNLRGESSFIYKHDFSPPYFYNENTCFIYHYYYYQGVTGKMYLKILKKHDDAWQEYIKILILEL